MLRWNTFARLAFKHSPEKEQRLLGISHADDKDAAPESADFNAANTSDGVNQIEAISRRLRNDALVNMPEILSKIPDKAGLLRMAISSGSIELNDAMTSIAQKRGINLTRATQSEKETVLDDVMKEPLNALAIARIAEGYLRAYEALMELETKNLRKLGKGRKGERVLDAAQLQQIIDTAKNSAPEDREVLRKKVMKELDLEQEFLSSNDDILMVDVLTIIEDTLKAEFQRNGFVDPKDADNDCAAGREKKLSIVTKQYGHAKEMLELSLQAEAQKTYDEYCRVHDKHAMQDNKATLKNCGVTAKGIIGAFSDNTKFYWNIRRNNSAENAEYNLPASNDNEYLNRVGGAIRRIADAKALLKPAKYDPNDKDAPPKETVFMRDMRLEEERKENLAHEIGEEIDELISLFSRRQKEDEAGATEALAFLRQQNTVYGSFGNTLHAPTVDRIKMRTMPFEAFNKTKETLRALKRTPDLFVRMAEANRYRETAAENNTEAGRTELREKLGNVFPLMMQNLTHDVCKVLDINKQLTARQSKILMSIAGAAEYEGTERGTNCFAHASSDIGEFDKAQGLLDRLYNNPSIQRRDNAYFEGINEFGTRGYFDELTGTIWINTTLCGDRENDVIEHERGHAVLDILTRRTGVFPNLYVGLGERLEDEAKKQNVSLEVLRNTMADEWECKRNGVIDEDDFLDELVVQYADWKRGRNTNPTAGEHQLFALFEDQQQASVPDGEDDAVINMSGKRKKAKHREDDEEGEEDAPKEMVRDLGMELREIETSMQRFTAFFKVYPERLNDEGVQETLDFIEQEYANAKAMFDRGDPKEVIEPVIKETKRRVGLLEKEIKRIDTLKMDLMHVEPSQRGDWRKAFSNISWMSIYDMGTMFKEAGEDIQRMWKRRGEGVRATVGKGLFGVFHDKIPYIGQLSREFSGREQSSEQEEVSVWEKRYTTLDSYTLLHDILPESVNKDELKAIINLLTKKGRMDWNDKNLWHKLESLSEFHMPELACERDIVLRDQHLQKQIANIWKDKDLFEGWKNENDSKINSGKSSYQGTMDNLSGTKGGLAGRLEYLLGKHMLIRKHIPISEEEEINPHLYEGILHYAMKNGKMALEDKIFYLIQGVAYDFLSIDRMKGLLGEGGGILNTFPFIDFFNGKTRADIQRMAERLGFDEDPKKAIKEPDFRTADFILEEVSTDEGARARVWKAITNSPKNIDHEDFPGIIAMLDHQGISEIVNMVSGSNRKITAEGQQNIYVGYNSLLQRYAIKAKLYKEGRGQFTNSDFKNLVVALTAYAHFDNITTGAATEGSLIRPKLSWNQINGAKPVSGGNYNYTTSKYRDRANGFLSNLIENLGIPNIGGVDPKQYLGRDRNEATFLGDKQQTDKVFDATGKFVPILQSAILGSQSKKDLVIDMLAGMAGKSHDTGGFIPENSDYTYEKVKNMNRQDSMAESQLGGRSARNYSLAV